MLKVGGLLPAVRRQNGIDLMLLFAVVVLGTVAITGVIMEWPVIAVQAAVIALVAVAFGGVYVRMISRPDHVRALQSDRMLQIANESIAFLRQGLDERTAEEVCRIALRETEAAAVAITDRHRVLGFAGVGEDHHLVGGPVITRATMESIELNESRILHSRSDIGCPQAACKLRAAIVVPLEMRGEAVGTLKFYYTSDRFLNETQLAMAEGLARLLSTQLELSELERQTELATEMELKALQAQINPHFLFNTINTIAAFIRTDPVEARRLLRQFGTFYRRTLEQAADLVTVERELEFVSTYVELEKARFGDRLRFAIDADPGVLDTPMPSFMIQPLVENAIGHGMRPDGSALHVSVKAGFCSEGVCVEVRDDGVGIPSHRLATVLEPQTSKGLGIAMGNVRDRLSGYFGQQSRFEIDSVEGEGTTITLVISPVPRTTANSVVAPENHMADAGSSPRSGRV